MAENRPVKKITAATLEECKEKLFDLYGQDYEIVGKKQDFKGGIFGHFQKEVITVEYIEKQRTVKTPSFRQNSLDWEESRKAIIGSVLPSGSNDSIIQIARLSKQMENFEKAITDSINEVKQAASVRDEHRNISKIREILTNNEFTPAYIEKIVSLINKEFSIDDLDDFEKMQRYVICRIGDDIHIAPPVRETFPKVIIVVGPTGVGKTTTIAKLAAAVLLKHRNSSEPGKAPKIRMITTDSMRVGAEEQIKNWGETMEIPVDKAEHAGDLVQLYNLYKDTADYIFVDTSGYSPNDFENIARMHSLLDVKGLEPNIYLAFSAGGKPRDIENIIRNYEQFDYRGVIITKCDETTSYGNVISVLSERNKRIAFVTDGQNVLHTIKRASKMRFLRTISGINADKDYLEAKFPEESSDNLI
ncbi:MAG: hypothetical protein J5780_02490 [Treponema sp.]|nr:hypothetical protein [Treponema sp.]